MNYELFFTAYTVSAAFIISLYAILSKNGKLKKENSNLMGILFLLIISILLIIIDYLLFNIEFPFEILVSFPDIEILYIGNISIYLFIISWIYLFYTMILAYSRVYHLREKRILRHFFPFIIINRYFEKKKEFRDYQDFIINRNVSKERLLYRIFKSKENKFNAGGISAIISLSNNDESIDVIEKIINDSNKNDETLNIVCINKHPYEIFSSLNHSNKKMLAYLQNNVVFIDIFTKIYGFDDDIYDYLRSEMKRMKICVITTNSIAGLHSATNSAFIYLRKKNGSIRKPNTMIWDSISSLEHAFPPDLIKTFIHHTLPSEKYYKMLSIYLEYVKDENGIKDLITSLADVKRASIGEIYGKD